MAGSILADGRIWTCSGAMFYGLLEVIAAQTSSPSLRAHIAEIDSQNLGTLVIDDLDESDRTEFKRIAAGDLYQRFVGHFPGGDPDAQAARRPLFDELAAMLRQR